MPTQSGPARSKSQRELDRARTAHLYLQGKKQAEIAQELGISQQMVSHDLALLRRRWRAEANVDMRLALGQELARIDHLEAHYWQAWERSQAPHIRTRHRHATDATTPPRLVWVECIEETTAGDPAFLAGVAHCIELRCKLLGLYETNITVDWRASVVAQGGDPDALLADVTDALATAMEKRKESLECYANASQRAILIRKSGVFRAFRSVNCSQIVRFAYQSRNGCSPHTV
jgi:hypothetical protein